MYLKIVVDKFGNTQMIIPKPKLDVICPFCRTTNIYIFEQDLKLFCNYCGKLLVSIVNNGNGNGNGNGVVIEQDYRVVTEDYTDEQITDFIRILTEGGSICDRSDAAVSLGKISRKNKRIGTIFSVLYKVSKSDPELEIREYAMEAIEKLKGIPVSSGPEVLTKTQEVIKGRPANKEVKLPEASGIPKSPYRTFKIEDLPLATREKVQNFKDTKPKDTKPEDKISNSKKYSMEDDLLSLLSDI
jgi:hypothetical protein